MVLNFKNEFDKQKWLICREQRVLMVDAIIKSRILVGMTKTEVLQLLGFEFNDINSNTWTYYIGKKRRIFLVNCFLYIYFDAAGKVFKILKK